MPDESSVFLFTMAHDLRAALRTMLMQAQRVLRQDPQSISEETRQRIQDILTAGKQQEELIASVVELEQARQQDGPSPMEYAIPLRIAIQTACTKTDAYRTKVGGEVEFDLADCPQALVPSSLSKVIEKVLHNALKFHAEGNTPQITINVSSPSSSPGWIYIRISDHGIGIEPQFRASVFEPFKRLHPVSAYPGSGLGLSIALSLTRKVGGEVTIEDSPSLNGGSAKGTTVSIRLPLNRTA